jgi:hypothetical protein
LRRRGIYVQPRSCEAAASVGLLGDLMRRVRELAHVLRK